MGICLPKTAWPPTCMIAEGTTEITDIQYIDRGYEKIEEKFKALGADIYRVDS